MLLTRQHGRMPYPTPEILSADDLPLAELHALRLRGELVALGEGFAPLDQPSTPASRAASLEPTAPPNAIIDRMSAAWVWGASDEPPPVTEFAIDITLRKRKLNAHLVVREVAYVDGDLTEIVAGMQITTVQRTMIDLARDDSLTDGAAIHVIARLIEGAEADADRALRWLAERGRLSFAVPASARIRTACGLAVVDPVDVVDGVDAPDGVQHTVQVRRVAHLEHEPAERKAVA